MAPKKSATASTATTPGKPGRKAAPANESKNEKFLRLAAPRVTKAIKGIRVIGNLGSSAYERTDEQVTRIIDALTLEVTNLKKRLDPSSKSGKETASFQF